MFRLRFIPQQLEGEIMKHWKIVVSAVVIAVVTNISLADTGKGKIPDTWTSFGKIETHRFGRKEGVSPILSKSNRPISIFYIYSLSPATREDSAGITKTIDVKALRGRSGTVASWYKQTGRVMDKDIWVRFTCEDGVDVVQQAELYAEQIEGIVVAELDFDIPKNANTMEVGIGMQGVGSMEILEFGASVFSEGKHHISHRNMRAHLAETVKMSVPFGSKIDIDGLFK